jgi:hypothetical protein
MRFTSLIRKTLFVNSCPLPTQDDHQFMLINQQSRADKSTVKSSADKASYNSSIFVFMDT